MDELVERLRKGKFRTFEEVRLQSSSTHYFVLEGDIDIFSTIVNSSGIEDDDIIAGKQKMTLKCPVCMPFTLHLQQLKAHCPSQLSYTRIKIPCRSDKCVHPQCFDAVSWYSVMEQTTTWLCPVCDKALEPNDLIVDGYVSLCFP